MEAPLPGRFNRFLIQAKQRVEGFDNRHVPYGSIWQHNYFQNNRSRNFGTQRIRRVIRLYVSEQYRINDVSAWTINAAPNATPFAGAKTRTRSRPDTSAVPCSPTSTGAAKAVGLVLPELAGKLDGTSIRVPTPNVSVVDFKFRSKKKTSVEAVNAAIVKAAGGKLKGILETSEAPTVSIDYNHNQASSTFDLTQTQVIDGRFVRILAWYDNEWGFSNRMSDTAVALAKV